MPSGEKRLKRYDDDDDDSNWDIVDDDDDDDDELPPLRSQELLAYGPAKSINAVAGFSKPFNIIIVIAIKYLRLYIYVIN